MKANRVPATIEFLVLFFLALIAAIAVSAQAPIYKFKNSTLASGTGGQINAVYRFPNVKTGGGSNIDALVKITNKVGNITLLNIDRNADGYNEAFQPEYQIGALANAYFDFQITFVQSGTNTPAPQPLVELSALDIDGFDTLGYTLKEFNRLDLGGGTLSYNLMGTQLTVYQVGTAYEGDNITGALFGALVDTVSTEVMFSVSNVNVTSFTYRVGANNLLPAQTYRYASLYFKKFIYPQEVVLGIKNLISFNGTVTDNRRNLEWTLVDGSDATHITLEKSLTGTSFQPFAEFWVTADANAQKNFSYVDSKTAENLAYYRLKIVTKDNKVQYSSVLRLGISKNAANQLAVFPTLIQSAATLNYISKEKQNAIIMVTDMSGLTVQKQNVLMQEGVNSIQLSGFDQYRKGNYVVSVITAGQKLARCVVVQ